MSKQVARSVIRLALLSNLFMLGLWSTASAQQFTGTLRGTVHDSAGAGAEVVITNQNTGVTLNTTSNSDGNYIAPQLPPGIYKITVKRTGFKSAALAAVKLDVQQIREADVTLDVGQTTETVSISTAVTVLAIVPGSGPQDFAEKTQRQAQA